MRHRQQQPGARRRAWPAGAAGNRRRARYLAPAAFLLAVTAAVLLIRSGLNGSGSSTGPAVTGATSTVPTATEGPTTVTETVAKKPARKRYYVITSGDTLDLIASRFDTTVDRLLRLNPGIEPTALTPGQKVRIR